MDAFPYRALVVEDEPAIRQLTVRSLVREGFRCDQADNGRRATELLERDSSYDVVVTDLRMPEEHGYAVVQRTLRRPHRPLVVVLTGLAEPRLVRQLLREGVDDVVLKPVEFSVFAAKVKALVEVRTHSPHLQEATADECPAERLSTFAEEAPAPGARDGNDPFLEATVTDQGPTAPSLTRPTPPQELDESPLEYVRRRPDAEQGGTLQLVGKPHPNTAALRALLAHAAAQRSPGRSFRGLSRRVLIGVAAVVMIALSLPMAALLADRRTLAELEHVAESIELLPEDGVAVAIHADQWATALPLLDRLASRRPLTVRGAALTDADAEHLPRLAKLQGLDLRSTAISDAALANVGKLQELEQLRLGRTQVTSRGLKHLAGHPRLEVLDLSHTAISDEGLEVVARMPSLRLVDLSGNSLSTPALERLRRARPEMSIVERSAAEASAPPAASAPAPDAIGAASL